MVYSAPMRTIVGDCLATNFTVVLSVQSITLDLVLIPTICLILLNLLQMWIKAVIIARSLQRTKFWSVLVIKHPDLDTYRYRLNSVHE